MEPIPHPEAPEREPLCHVDSEEHTAVITFPNQKRLFLNEVSAEPGDPITIVRGIGAEDEAVEVHILLDEQGAHTMKIVVDGVTEYEITKH